MIDILLSLTGLILASWLYLLIMIAIEMDDPGPVFFSQKRVGIHKKYFQLYKFRSMKMSTPHDMPTHLLENPAIALQQSSTSHASGNFCAKRLLMRFRSSGISSGAT